MRLLFYGESSFNPTGFGHVNRHLLAACSRVADVTAVLSTHYKEDYSREEYPYEIIGCEIVPLDKRDATHQRNLPNIMRKIEEAEWDVFMFQGDCGWSNDVLVAAYKVREKHPEKHAIFYVPIDGDVSFSLSFEFFKLCSAGVVYTHHGLSVIERYAPDVAKYISVIQLGCETDIFYPLSEEERLAARFKLFGEEYMNQFLCINVNRNQPRKDIARCMGAFHLFHQKHPDSSLYLHSVQNDAGGNLTVQAAMNGCEIIKQPPNIVPSLIDSAHPWRRIKKVEKFPAEIVFSSLDLANPWSRAALNEMYNAADCLISTAHGEGWGLTTTEAMSAGVPVVVPANTANLDILGKQLYNFDYERGWGVRTGGDIDHTVYMYTNGGGPVAIIHSDSFVETLEYVYHHRDEAQEKAKVARKWCEENTWEKRETDWENLLRLMATKPVQEEVLV
jgi:glycosyltransferase involved in cell wall biosynthesis